MFKIEGGNFGFARIEEAGFGRVEGATLNIRAKKNQNDEQLFTLQGALKLTFVSVESELSKILLRQLNRYLARLYVKPRTNARLILISKLSGKKIFDGKVILKPRKGRVAKIAGRSLNHGTH